MPSRLEKREYDADRDVVCPNCRRVVVKVNHHRSLGTCVFCDLNREGVE